MKQILCSLVVALGCHSTAFAGVVLSSDLLKVGECVQEQKGESSKYILELTYDQRTLRTDAVVETRTSAKFKRTYTVKALPYVVGAGLVGRATETTRVSFYDGSQAGQASEKCVEFREKLLKFGAAAESL